MGFTLAGPLSFEVGRADTEALYAGTRAELLVRNDLVAAPPLQTELQGAMLGVEEIA